MLSSRLFYSILKMGILRTLADMGWVYPGLAITAGFAAALTPQTLGLRYYRRIYEQNEDGKPVPLTDETQDRIQGVWYG